VPTRMQEMNPFTSTTFKDKLVDSEIFRLRSNFSVCGGMVGRILGASIPPHLQKAMMEIFECG